MHLRAIVLGCLFVLSACAAWAIREPLNVTIADITPLDMNLLEQRYAVKVRLLNPNDVDIAFDGVVFDLEVNDKPFAKGVSDRGGTIPRFGEAVIDIQVVTGLQNILRQIVELQKEDRAGFSYHIKGRLHSKGGFAIPFDTKGEFALPSGDDKSGA
jgi:LEA14-like dessication related protein